MTFETRWHLQTWCLTDSGGRGAGSTCGITAILCACAESFLAVGIAATLTGYWLLCAQSTTLVWLWNDSYCVYTEGIEIEQWGTHVIILKQMFDIRMTTILFYKATLSAFQDIGRKMPNSGRTSVTSVPWYEHKNWHIPSRKTPFSKFAEGFQQPRRKSLKKFCIPMILMVQKLTLCAKTQMLITHENNIKSKILNV